MKRVAMWLAGLLLAFGVHTVAFADAVQGGDIRGTGSDPIKTVFVSDDTNSAGDFLANSYILGFKLYANDAGDACTLYDGANTATVANVIDEWIEATDEETNIQIWPFPKQLATDLSISTNGICGVYYQ